MASDRDRQITDRLHALLAAATSGADLDALGSARDLRALLYEWEGVLARRAVEAGASWEEVGALLGVSKQAAWTRYRDSRSETTAIREARDRVAEAARRAGRVH